MIDHQVDRHQRVDLSRIAAQAGHGRAHRSQVDHRRHTGEILHHDARRLVRAGPGAARGAAASLPG